MKRLFSMAAVAALVAGSAATQAHAATAVAALDANSAYVWRGMTLNNGFVLQPSMDVSQGGFAFNVWGNYDVDDYNGTLNENRFSEVDLTGTYTHKIGSVDASVGVIHYLFPEAKEGADTHTTELFVGLAYDLGAGFNISTKFYYDIDAVSDYFVTAGLGYTYDLNPQTALGLSGMISYAGEDFTAYYVGGTDSGFFNYTLTASVKYKVNDAFSIGANVNLTDNLDSKAMPDEAVHTNVYGGLNLSYTF